MTQTIPLLAALTLLALSTPTHAQRPVHKWDMSGQMINDLMARGSDSDAAWQSVALEDGLYMPFLAARWATTGKQRASDSTTRAAHQLAWSEAVFCRVRVQGQTNRWNLGIMFMPTSQYWRDNSTYRYACIQFNAARTAVRVGSHSTNRVQLLYTHRNWHGSAWVPRADHRARQAGMLPSRQWLTEGSDRFAVTTTGASGDPTHPCVVERQVGRNGSDPIFEFTPGYTLRQNIQGRPQRCLTWQIDEDKPGWDKTLRWSSALFTGPNGRFRLFRLRNL